MFGSLESILAEFAKEIAQAKVGRPSCAFEITRLVECEWAVIAGAF